MPKFPAIDGVKDIQETHMTMAMVVIIIMINNYDK